MAPQTNRRPPGRTGNARNTRNTKNTKNAKTARGVVAGGRSTRATRSRRRQDAATRTARTWGMIALVAVLAIATLAIVGYPAYQAWQSGRPLDGRAAAAIDGLVDYRATDAARLTRDHTTQTVRYFTSPPVGGDHAAAWQTCQGNVYAEPIADENAVHSLEHGAVWITYRPDLPADQVAALRAKVSGTDYLLMSPYPALDRPVSVQAWGYQLKVDSADDLRIDEFIRAFRLTASVEPGATCSGGLTSLGQRSQAEQSEQADAPMSEG